MRTAKKTIIAAISAIAFLFIGPMHIARSLWFGIFSYQPAPANVGFRFVQEAYAKTLATIEEALKSFLPDAQTIDKEIKTLTDIQKETISTQGKVKFDPEFDREFHFYVGKSDGKIIGYAVNNFARGKWGLIHYMVHLDPKGIVQSVMVLDYQEKRGRPIAKKRFLKQFKGKSIEDKIRINKDIKGVTGASISSNGMVSGVRKMVHVFNELYVQSK